MRLTSWFALAAVIAATTGFAVPSRAADVIPEPELYDWSGFYVGVHGGYGWGDVDVTDQDGYNNLPATTDEFDIDGFLGGGQIGWNWQTGPWVLGLEGDLGYLGAEGSVPLPGPGGTTVASIDGGFYATATGRLGWAFDEVMVYAKGGAAFADLNAEVTDPGLVSATGGDGMETGYTLGGGVEWAIGDSWTLKGEYLYFDFGSVETSGTSGGSTFRWDNDIDIHTVKIGVNFKF